MKRRIAGYLLIAQERSAHALRLALSALFVLPLLVVLALVKHRVGVRIVHHDATRIGHFVLGVSAWTALDSQPTDLGRHMAAHWWSGPVSNVQWAAMAERSLGRFRLARYIAEWIDVLPGANRLVEPVDGVDHFRTPLLWRRDGRLPFLPEENQDVVHWLMNLGWRADQPIACVLARDPEYTLREIAVHPAHDWSYHSYRNSDIDSWRPALDVLLDAGYWVFRMGKRVSQPLALDHPRFVDYATSGLRSDLRDIWLFAHCAISVSNLTGIDITPAIYRRPLLHLNFLPLVEMWCASDVLMVPKRLWWRDSGAPLTLREHCRHGYYTTAQYREAGIEYADQPSSVMKATAAECLAGLGDAQPAMSDLQSRFWREYAQLTGFGARGLWRNPRARVGEAWLRAQPAEFWD